jgi:hypothetical protein
MQQPSDNNSQIWPITDTRPNPASWAFDAPNHSRRADFNEHQYREDLKWFDKNPKRNANIRYSLGDFPPPQGQGLEAGAPSLWVAVIRTAPGWHFRLPIWRGRQPYSNEPKTDEQVMAIIAECRSEGGYELAALQKWRANSGGQR